jgi:ArsR family transcriptional regulator, arsenate/arsenite/antimonite-responsive transcriptional repressor
MRKQNHSLYEARAAIIKALAHPTRLFIVEELQKHDRNVGELVEMIGADFSTVSKHLTILKNAGLVTDERKGTTITYHLKTPCVLSFIGCIEEVLEINANDQLKVLSCCKK